MKGRKNVLFSMRTDSKIQYIVGKPTEGKRLKTFVNQSSDFVHDVILENLKNGNYKKWLVINNRLNKLKNRRT